MYICSRVENIHSALAGRQRYSRHLIELLLVSVAVGLADCRVIEIARDKPACVNESRPVVGRGSERWKISNNDVRRL